MAFGLDSNFSEAALVGRINADLANDLGNLVSRTLAMVERFRKGNDSPAGGLEDKDVELKDLALKIARKRVHDGELGFHKLLTLHLGAHQTCWPTGTSTGWPPGLWPRTPKRQGASTRSSTSSWRCSGTWRPHFAFHAPDGGEDPGLPGISEPESQKLASLKEWAAATRRAVRKGRVPVPADRRRTEREGEKEYGNVEHDHL